MRREPRRLERIAGGLLLGQHIAEILLDEVRQHEAVVQLACPSAPAAPADTAGCQKRATSERSSSCCVRLMRACGGISKARSSSSPRRPSGPSGEYSLSMQNSARWVLPVTSISRLRNSRSVSHGGTSLPGAGSCWNAISSSYSESLRASSTRGACEVGPMNRPENRYDSDGWLCQYASRLASRSGRRRNGESARCRAAEHEVIAAAGAGVAAVEHEFLGAEAQLARRLVQERGVLDQLVPNHAPDGC